MARYKLPANLYYITHIENLPSIFKQGILSHEKVESCGIKPERIYNLDVVNRRKNRKTPDGLTLWQFANLYYHVRNPMLYQVMKSVPDARSKIVVLAVDAKVLEIPGTWLSTGNAASDNTQFMSVKDGLKYLRSPEMRRVFENPYWSELDGSKRKIMAECLVRDRIPPDRIRVIYVAGHVTANSLKGKVPTNIYVVPEPDMFFQPRGQSQVSEKLFLVDGDMFLSTMQTLTISVNTVGVMGKGLASRAKYQFPDVYVYYQDLCRSRRLKMGFPAIYKREGSLDEQLADHLPASQGDANARKWFLLFPTKKHWRDQKSDLAGIEQGLIWLKDNYKSEGIQSIALPALGCGLGNLEWREVGPLMSKILVHLDITSCIYLPREQEIPSEMRQAEYLLR